jgi:hypothetical protein
MYFVPEILSQPRRQAVIAAIVRVIGHEFKQAAAPPPMTFA